MSQNQIATNSFQNRVLKLVMSFDRIFLFRKLFVMMAMLLLVTALAFAQSNGARSSGHNRGKSSKANAASESLNAPREQIIYGEAKPLGSGQGRSWGSL